MKKIFLTLILSSLILSACTTDPYTGERKISNSALYGSGGAVAGALVGQLAGGNTKSTLIGAAVGGALGAGAGYYFDNQESKLRAELQGTGVSVKRTGDKIKLVMPGNITFASNSADIASSSYKVLNSIAKVFKEYKKTDISIKGYTDSMGDDEQNQILSQSRAQSVADYLANQGIESTRLKAAGYGAANPIASNDSAEGRAKNRRVEIDIVPAK